MRYRTLYKWFQSSMFSMDSWSSQYAWLVTWISGYLESVIVYFPNCSIAARIAIYILSKCSALSDTTCGYMSRCPSVWNFIPAFPGGGNMVASWYSIIDLVFSPLSALPVLSLSVCDQCTVGYKMKFSFQKLLWFFILLNIQKAF